MDPTRFRQRVQNGDSLFGVAINYPAAGIIDTIGSMWDFLWLDGQHGQISSEQMLSLVRTADAVGVDTIMRVPGRETGIVGPYVDMAPSAVMIPMINTREDALAAVHATRFPPLGSRSFGGRRPIDTMDRTYYRGREPLVVAQIETPQAVENCDKIAGTDGIDMLMLGPDDLKTHLGLAIDCSVLDTPILLAAFEKVAKAASEVGKQAMCIATTPELANRAHELGYRIFVGGSDVYFLRRGSQESLQMLQSNIGCGNSRKQKT